VSQQLFYGTISESIKQQFFFDREEQKKKYKGKVHYHL
jgi:hypothetical protein